eukprot:776362-Pyramimonas_sp.AAC.1
MVADPPSLLKVESSAFPKIWGFGGWGLWKLVRSWRVGPSSAARASRSHSGFLVEIYDNASVSVAGFHMSDALLLMVADMFAFMELTALIPVQVSVTLLTLIPK